MARGKRGRGGGGGRGGGRGNWKGAGSRNGGADRPPKEDNRVSFDKLEKKNPMFEGYYNQLKIIPEDEREAFWTTYRTELPTSFRFTGSKGDALALNETFLARYSPKLQMADYAGEKVTPPKALDWYPNQLAYSMNVPKNVVRKNENFKDFQRFQVLETAIGNMNRQEVVSMIPPLFLDVQPDHIVLDMCAAPGSKTAQLIEMLHQNEEENIREAIAEDGQNGTGQTTGVVIANDSNYKRAQMLVHQTKRLNSPNLIVTCHDATMFPSIALAPGDGVKKGGKYVYFDRILADVPCSGDGTLRKNPNIWADWNPQSSLGLYMTQVRILVRALQLLKAGGRVVYSTCSMNPVEDEAVVSSAIERCGGSKHVRIVDCSEKMPTLKRSPGLTDWSIINRDDHIYKTWFAAQMGEDANPMSKIVPGMFAPCPEEEIPLERCMRFYPHTQNTGGFFVTVLERCSDVLTVKEEIKSKCSNKNWEFKKEEAAPAYSATALINGIESGNLPPAQDSIPASNGDVSAAERQNGPIPDNSDRKRKAGDDGEDGSSKKAKQNGASADGDTPPEFAQPGGTVEPGDTDMSRTDDLASAADIEDPAANGDDNDTNNDIDEAGDTGMSRMDDVSSTTNDQRPQPQLAKGGARDQKNKPEKEYFKYLDQNHDELQSIYRSYKLHAAFPRKCFLVRNNTGDPKKGIYYTSAPVKQILEANEARDVKFVNAGVKMFMRQDTRDSGACPWRVQIEGLPIIQGWVSEDKVVRMWRKDTLYKLLKEMFVKVNVEDNDEGQGWRSMPDIGEQVRGLPVGCYMLRFKATQDDDGYNHDMTFPLWKGVNSINLMAPKDDRKALLYRIFKDDSDLVNNNDPPNKGQNGHGNVKGSVSGQADAEELQKRMDRGDDPDIVMEEDGGIEGTAMALEADALAKRDEMEREKMEMIEDEDTKVTDAMPERQGEGDDYNTTV